MRSPIEGGLAFAMTIALALPVAAASPSEVKDYGTWRNPQNSVHVHITPCGTGACGIVIWANAKAQADALKGGTKVLVGTQLFREFHKRKDGSWDGKVFVPDINKTFSGTAVLVAPDKLKAKGCLFGRVGCKSEIWIKI
jgi:uncharacterized protein (DUF2147 family)